MCREDPIMVAEGPEGCILLHAYVDGVPISGGARTNKNGVLVWTMTPKQQIQDLNAKRLLTVCLKKWLCSCGCGGRHTVVAIERVFRWSVLACRSGVMPGEGPFEEPLQELGATNRMPSMSTSD